MRTSDDFEIVEMRSREPREVNLAIVLCVVLLVACAALFFVYKAHSNLLWVHGKYGEKCYLAGSEHKNIKYPVYFNTRQECLDDL